jgi:YD repeat-containing protein
VSVTDPAGAVTQYRYDSTHRITAVIDANDAQISNPYDSGNRVISQTDAAGRTTSFAYSDTRITITDGIRSRVRRECLTLKSLA